MTCIVGVAKGGKVYIGADSLGSNGFTKEIRKECKVFKSGEFLVGVKGRLFKISGDFQVSEHDYVSCGSGEYHAVGCLYNSKLTKPKEDVIKALECAENFVVSVSRPFTVLCI